VMFEQCPAVSTQSGVTSVPVHRNGPNVISATDGYSPGLASLPPTTADDGEAPAHMSAVAVADTVRTLRRPLMCAGTHTSARTCG
jgi:hypothetical protein